MCITIPSSANVQRSRQWAVWRWLSDTPLRLYGFGGVLFLVLGLMPALLWSRELTPWSGYNLLFLILPTPLLGVLFRFLPDLLRVSPLSYVKFAAHFFVLSATQLAIFAAAVLGEAPGIFYLCLTALAWVMALGYLRGMLLASYRSDLGWRLLPIRLMPAFAAAALLAGVALKAGWLVRLPVGAWLAAIAFELLLLCLPLLLLKRHPIRRR